jgi:hypothetical protein
MGCELSFDWYFGTHEGSSEKRTLVWDYWNRASFQSVITDCFNNSAVPQNGILCGWVTRILLGLGSKASRFVLLSISLRLGYKKDTQVCKYIIKVCNSEEYAPVCHRHVKDNCEFLQPGNFAVTEYLGEDGELPCEIEIAIETSKAAAVQYFYWCIPVDRHDVYKNIFWRKQNWVNSWYMIKKIIMWYHYMHLTHKYNLLYFSSLPFYVKWLLDVMYLIVIKIV